MSTKRPGLLPAVASLLVAVSMTACVIVVNDDETDAEWVGSYDHEGKVEADEELRDQVGARLAQSPRLRDEDINVSVDNGVVTLTGKVDDASLVPQAVEAAAAVEGVRRVVARLTVEVSAS
ncbi:MAG: BON domain-containing protein [Gammaproteobacteria bacterium]